MSLKAKNDRLRLAWVSPFPPDRTGIADYSVEMVRALQEVAELCLFMNHPAEFDVAELNHLPRYRLDELPDRRFDFDLPIYQLGNYHLHAPIYQLANRFPGIVFVHDGSLLALLHTLARSGERVPMREVVYEKPQTEDRLIASWESATLDLQFIKRVADVSLGVVAHSRYLANQIDVENKKVIPHFALAGKSVPPWPLDESAVVFCCGGFMTPAKKIDWVLDSLVELVADGVNAKLLLIGKVDSELPLDGWIKQRGLTERVTQTGYVADAAVFDHWLAQAHVTINLREPTLGETSGVVMRSMALGRPVIVSNHGWYGELPDCCVKIEPHSAEALTSAMRTVAANLDAVKQNGAACHTFTLNNHQPSQIVAELVTWIEQTREGVEHNLISRSAF